MSGYERPVATEATTEMASSGAWFPEPPAKGSPAWQRREAERVEREQREAERDARIAAFDAEIAHQSAHRGTVWAVISQAESDDRNYEAWHPVGDDRTGIVGVFAAREDAEAARVACVEAHIDRSPYPGHRSRDALAENLIVVELPVLTQWRPR